MHESLFQCLTIEQVNFYENIMTTVLYEVGELFSYTDTVQQEKLLCGEHCPLPLDLKRSISKEGNPKGGSHQGEMHLIFFSSCPCL